MGLDRITAGSGRRWIRGYAEGRENVAGDCQGQKRKGVTRVRRGKARLLGGRERSRVG